MNYWAGIINKGDVVKLILKKVTILRSEYMRLDVKSGTCHQNSMHANFMDHRGRL